MPYEFRGQHRNEEVLLLCRQHPCVLVRPLLWAVVILLVPFVVGIFASVGLALALSVILALACGLGWAAAKIYGWWNSIFLLTTERAVLLLQRNPFSREFSEANLNAVLQVSHEIKGILPTLCGFGSISVYTGGAQQPMVVPNLPDPYEIQQEIQAAVSGELTE